MAQTQDEHLTTEQLSAAFDKQLSPQEQTFFDAHIATCKQCQSNLADLRLTAVLLHALPQEEVPRSFILPSKLAIVPDQTIRPDTTSPVPQRQHTRPSTLQRSIRVVSTLAAVLALCFILSGILPFIFTGGASNSSSNTTTSSSTGEVNQNHPAAIPGIQVTSTIPSHERVGTTAPTPIETHTLTPTGTATAQTSPNAQSNQGPGIPPVLDPGQPEGRLGLGVLLLVLSSIGLIFTRRRRVTVH